jgi:hypothetical protein
VKEAAPEPPVTTMTFNHENVLNYLKDLPSDEYQQMAEAWGRMTNDKDFSQA